MISVNPKFYTLRTKILILTFGSIFLIILITGIVVIEYISSALEDEMGRRALAVARSVSSIEEIKVNVGIPGGDIVIQPIVEKARTASKVDYIVVVDMNRRRLSHPVKEYIGTYFLSGDLDIALNNMENISKAKGVMGTSVRAFSPIRVEEETRQVGVVVVGIVTQKQAYIGRSLLVLLYSCLLIGLFIAVSGSLYLSRNVKRALLSLEPEEIGRVFEERIALFQSIKEGIIAIDNTKKITILNHEAARIIGADENSTGKNVEQLIPQARLSETLQTGTMEKDREIVINGKIVIMTRVPIWLRNNIVGAVATFREKSDINRLAEELTSVNSFVEAIRVQYHEHMNKLQAIAGLIHLKRYQQVLDFIVKITEEQQEISRFVARNFSDYTIAGLLLGKYFKSKEDKIDFVITQDSFLSSLPERIDTNAMIAIIGNLLDNAFEAVKRGFTQHPRVVFRMADLENMLMISVLDNGPGIPKKKQQKVFEHGFTSKGTQHHGIGLYLVKTHVENAGGVIEIRSPQGGGAEFIVRIPKG